MRDGHHEIGNEGALQISGRIEKGRRMNAQADPLSLDHGELAARLEDLDGILRLAEPWLIDAGLVVPSQKLDGDRYMSSVDQAKAAMDAFLFSQEGFIGTMLCTRLDYCAFKKRYKRRMELVKATADALCTFMTGIPVPMILIAAYIVEDGYCDRLCGCSEAV